MRITRRRMLQMSAGSLLASGLWPGALAAQPPQTGAFRFLVINDLHYIDQRCGTWFDQRVLPPIRQAQQRPDFILVVGDLVENGTRAQFGPVKDLLDGLHIPYHVVIGNHDWRTQTERTIYKVMFPNQINYTFEHQGWQFIGLDTTEGTNYQNTSIASDTMRWLDDNLPRLNRQRPTVVFTHFPMGPTVTYRPRNAETLLNKFRDFNLQAVYNGHFHGFTERTVGRSIVTTNRCCAISRNNHDGSREKGYFQCQARERRIERTFVEVRPA
ncbi:MAG TPA: metallophosphoesterase [Gemmataceae bacterium]|nr:metallophosphoesterase [Gemmataceae bacterium]